MTAGTGPADGRSGNLARFDGFADLYDAHRATPPAALGPLLTAYAGASDPQVVDLGSGTGLSTRWAASWAGSVIGVEPNDDMRLIAEAQPGPSVRYVAAVAEATGLPDADADIVLAVQAMHWLEPGATLAEVARILRPAGVFAVVDMDWPPAIGNATAESAWEYLHRRIRVLEARVARGEADDELRAPIHDDDPALVGDDLADPHRDRAMPGGVRSWSKREHLARMRSSGHFAYTREVVMSDVVVGGTDRFIALMRSQGSYQGLLRAGLTDDEIGMTAFVEVVDAAPGGSDGRMVCCWRIRLGVRPDSLDRDLDADRPQ